MLIYIYIYKFNMTKKNEFTSLYRLLFSKKEILFCIAFLWEGIDYKLTSHWWFNRIYNEILNYIMINNFCNIKNNNNNNINIYIYKAKKQKSKKIK